MAEGFMKCVKLLLVVFNFLFFVIGLILCAVGGWVLSGFMDYTEISGLRVAPLIVIIVGAVILVIAFFGCCGAYHENHCMIMTFAVIVGFVLVLEVIAAIIAFAFKSKGTEFLEKQLQDSADKYKTSPDAEKFWDLVQHDFKCCGVQNYTTWADVTGQDGSLPDSCCKEQTTGCGNNTYEDPKAHNMYTEGCVKSFSNFVEDKIVLIGGVAIGLAFVEFMGILLACCLARSIKKTYETV